MEATDQDMVIETVTDQDMVVTEGTIDHASMTEEAAIAVAEADFKIESQSGLLSRKLNSSKSSRP